MTDNVVYKVIAVSENKIGGWGYGHIMVSPYNDVVEVAFPQQNELLTVFTVSVCNVSGPRFELAGGRFIKRLSKLPGRILESIWGPTYTRKNHYAN